MYSSLDLVEKVCRKDSKLRLSQCVCLLTLVLSFDLSQVLQKLGKSIETKDEQFELCFQNLNKQQVLQ